MLYDLTIGNHTKTILNQPWKVVTDGHNNVFIGKECIRQRICVDKRVENFKFNQVQDSNTESLVYELSDGLRLVNNNKNMNPMLMKIQDSAIDKTEQHIAYISIGTDYKLFSYLSLFKIAVTYHQEQGYLGCAVTFSEKEIEDSPSPTLMVLKVKNLQTKKYELIKIVFNIETKRVEIGLHEEIRSPRIINTLTEYDRKYKNSKTSLGFKVKPKESELLTCTYLVTPELAEAAKVLTQNIKNRNIVVIQRSVLRDNKKLKKLLTEEITEKRIRAITTMGIQLPISIVKEFKILYIFNYNTDDNRLICKKSN